MSVRFYPAHNFQPLVEFGETRLLPLILTAEYVNIVAERMPGLVKAMCWNEHFQWKSEDKFFRMSSTVAQDRKIYTRQKLDLFQTL